MKRLAMYVSLEGDLVFGYELKALWSEYVSDREGSDGLFWQELINWQGFAPTQLKMARKSWVRENYLRVPVWLDDEEVLRFCDLVKEHGCADAACLSERIGNFAEVARLDVQLKEMKLKRMRRARNV